MADEVDWQSRARCRGLDPDEFFVRGAAARAVAKMCDRCCVRDSCLSYAISNGIDFGVWGGMTERQRRAYQRRLVTAAS